MISDWKICETLPPVGTIVMIRAMVHLMPTDARSFTDADMLPGGLFAEIERENAKYTSQGMITVLTRPATLAQRPQYSTWTWNAPFPVTVGAFDYATSPMILLQPPEEVADAVRAFLALKGPTSDNMPPVVPDGWLC